MRAMRANQFKGQMTPVLVALMESEAHDDLKSIHFRDIDSFAAAEPSKGALVRLRSGDPVVIEIGKLTARMTVSAPVGAIARVIIEHFLDEVPEDHLKVIWKPEMVAPKTRRKKVERKVKRLGRRSDIIARAAKRSGAA